MNGTPSLKEAILGGLPFTLVSLDSDRDDFSQESVREEEGILFSVSQNNKAAFVEHNCRNFVEMSGLNAWRMLPNILDDISLTNGDPFAIRMMAALKVVQHFNLDEKFFDPQMPGAWALDATVLHNEKSHRFCVLFSRHKNMVLLAREFDDSIFHKGEACVGQKFRVRRSYEEFSNQELLGYTKVRLDIQQGGLLPEVVMLLLFWMSSRSNIKMVQHILPQLLTQLSTYTTGDTNNV